MRHYDLFEKEASRFYDVTHKLIRTSVSKGTQPWEAYIDTMIKGHHSLKTTADCFGWASACNKELILLANEECGGGALSFNKLMQTPTIIKSFAFLRMSLEDRGKRELWTYMAQGVRYVFHVLFHRLHGFKNYKVSDGLAAELHYTELKGLQCGDFHLPFPSIYVDAPKDLGFQVWNDQTGWHPFAGAYLAEDPQCFDYEYHSIDGELISVRGKDFREGRAFHLLLWGLPKDGGDPLIDDATVTFTVNLEDDGALLEDKVIEVCSRHPHLRRHEEWLGVVRWLANVVIYSTWPRASQELRWDDPKAAKLWESSQKGPKSHRKKLLNKLKKHGCGKSHYLGSDIIIDRKKGYENGHKSVGRTLTMRIPVTGHWRHYWVRVGSCRSRAKVPELRRIRPGWRGPEGAPISKKERKLK